MRTHTCGELRKKDAKKKVDLCGWVHSVREHGSLIFLDLRDRYGIIQAVINKKGVKKMPEIKSEYILKISGLVKERPKGLVNKNLDTGEIELEAKGINLIAKSETPPIEVDDNKEARDELRLKYRFLDLRRPKMQHHLKTRHVAMVAARDFFNKNNFLEVQTPMLVKPTPEGARDYVVPSRTNPGKFYALPQSPQLYKQILMISGCDRYYQLPAICLRDEDLRQDRQPEHSQMDFEMSFVSEKDIMEFAEGLFKHMFKDVLGLKFKKFPVFTYKEVMKKHGTDKPDLRKNKDDPNEFAFLWVKDFPLFSYNKDEKRWEPEHHMFTSPKKEHIKYLEKDPGKVQGNLFDIVLNGVEIGSGSIRINDPELQERVMKVIGLSKEKAHKKFGFLLDAYKYGGPPHGGMGLGFDRTVALMLGYNDIREVMAFPKNKTAQCPMDGSPADLDTFQLKELNLKLDIEKGKLKK